MWARDRTGYDPVSASFASRPVVVTTTAPGATYRSLDPIRGAAGGAALGAVGGAVAGDAGEGAAIGAADGGALGLLNTLLQPAAPAVTTYEHVVPQPSGVSVELAASYRRALTACLEGRGYTVR